MRPHEFAEDLAALCAEDNPRRRRGAFKEDVKRLVRTARAHGMSESEIRTQLGAKADAMQAALDEADA